jgi:putative RecB family exonuclease
MTTPTTELRPLSVSQYNSYTRCPHSWYLDRILKAWNRPAAWLPQGSAVHTVAECIELAKLGPTDARCGPQGEHVADCECRSGSPLSLEAAQDIFREEYAKEVGQYTEITPNFDWWFSSGPYRGAVDVERRYEIGLEQVEKFIRWDEAHPEEVIWIAPDGTPGIELGFDIELDGLRVRGFIDAIIAVPGRGVAVRDYKTGNTPGDDFQLGVYGVALQELYGVTPLTGDYYMAGKKGNPGKPTYPYDLTGWTRERVVSAFRELDENIRAERFEPKPEPSKCRFCSVQLACEFSLA